MPSIEVVPNSSGTSAPGWAYVPDTGYDPSRAPIQPSGARKRAARTLGFATGDTSTRQQNAIAKHLQELDKENHKDVQIPIPKRESSARGSKKMTQNARRILMSQKTFANHLADEEAAIAAQEQSPSAVNTPRPVAHKTKAALTIPKRQSTANIDLSRAEASQAGFSGKQTSATGLMDPPMPPSTLDPLLRAYTPSAPSKVVMDALLAGPPLSYNASRATLPPTARPMRHFCEICGYWGSIKCMKCGVRVCGLECKETHDEGRCFKFYA